MRQKAKHGWAALCEAILAGRPFSRVVLRSPVQLRFDEM